MLHSSNLYENIFLSSRNPICLLTPEGNISEFNVAYVNLFSGTPADQIGISFFKILGSDIPHGLLTAVKQGEDISFESQVPRNDGSIINIDLNAHGILDASNTLEAIVVAARDQRQRRKKDRQIDRFHQMLNQSNDAFFVIDTKTGQILDINHKACERYGYSHEEMLQLTVMNLNPEYHSIEDWANRIEKIKNKPANIFETTHVTRHGVIFPVEVSHQYVPDNERDYIIAVLRDISERKEAEKENKHSQEQWQRTFDSSTDVITIQNLQHEIIQCNQKAADMFKMSREECIGLTCYELFSGSSGPCPHCPAEIVTDHFEPYTEEVYHQRLDKTFSINVVPILNDEEGLTEIAHFATDITQQKKLEEQLRHAQKMESLGTLAGGIAHDFNNILSAVIGYSQLAQAYLPQGSKALHALEQINKGGQRATELVKQILAFSRKTEYAMTSVKIQNVVVEALELLRPSLPMPIEIQQEIDQDCPPVIADSAQIHQVIMNICTNAYHAMKEQNTGTLALSLRLIGADPSTSIEDKPSSAGTVLLTISDTGAGMGNEIRERIFEPYFTTKKQGEGTGLGLAVVHGIIQDFGGSIAVHSEPGKGTRFEIYLPAAKTGSSERQKPKEAGKISGGQEQLLIVDDEEPISELLKIMLESYGYQVTNTTDSLKALELYRQSPDRFDLVLTDYAMPKMNGATLAAELLSINPELPIVICSGFGDIDKKSATEIQGVRIYLNKPVQAEDLALTIRTVLDSPKTP